MAFAHFILDLHCTLVLFPFSSPVVTAQGDDLISRLMYALAIMAQNSCHELT